MDEITYKELLMSSLNNNSILVINKSKETMLASACMTANTFARRFLGLMFKRNLLIGNGLIIVPCNSIHTFFMRFPIDAIFISRDQTAVSIKQNLNPGKIIPPVKGACFVIELPVGTISKSSTEIGDHIKIYFNKSLSLPSSLGTWHYEL